MVFSRIWNMGVSTNPWGSLSFSFPLPFPLLSLSPPSLSPSFPPLFPFLLPFPFLPFPLPSLSPPSFPSLPPFPSPTLEVGPLNPARGSGGAL